MSKIKSYGFYVTTGVIALYALTTGLMFAAELPDVWFSHSTGECVKVLNYADGDAYNCENLPSRFYHVWVK